MHKTMESPTSVLASSSPLKSPVTPSAQFQNPVLSSQHMSPPTFFSKICSTKTIENDENEHYNPEEVYKY